jgi:hypothetical protein
MTPTKALRRIVAVLPAVIAPCMRSHGRCIAATRIGVEALRHFGVKAQPLAVDVQVFNAAAVQWVIEGQPGGTDEFVRRGCYYLSSLRGPCAGERPPTRINVGPTWDGHLVAHVPALGVIADFDFRQLARPEFGIVTAPAMVAGWDGDLQECVLDGGARVLYRPRLDPMTGRPDEIWRESPDWTKPIDDLVRVVVRAARRVRAGDTKSRCPPP